MSSLILPGDNAFILADAHAATHLPAGADPITTATPVAIVTTNAAGTAESLVRSDHGHEITDARLVVVTGDANSLDLNGDALSTSFVDRATLSFTMPTGWNTALIVARGSISIDISGTPTGDLEWRVEIGSDNGTTMTFTPLVANENTHVASHSATATGNVTVAIAARKVAGSDLMDIYVADVSYIAVRAS